MNLAIATAGLEIMPERGDNPPKKTGNRATELLLTAGEVQADIARSYGVSQATISRMAAPGPFDQSAAGTKQ